MFKNLKSIFHKIKFLRYILTEKDLTEEQANVELNEELQKPLPDRDTPRIRRLFRQTFTLRRNDGSVRDLVAKFPLLTDPAYVCTYDISKKIFVTLRHSSECVSLPSDFLHCSNLNTLSL